MPSTLRLAPAIILGKATAVASRALRLGGGTTMPGRVARAVAPDIARQLAARLPQGCVVVTGTNGKTTTSRLIHHILQLAGLRPVHNRAGANLAAGIVTALVQHTDWRGRARGDIGIFEVDEATLPAVWDPLQPRAVVLTNLFRDQLDRYGEIDIVAGRWRAVLDGRPPGETVVIFNADDPLVSDVGAKFAGTTVPFGIADASCGAGTLEHAADARYCYRCGVAYEYTVVYFGHMGDYRCPQCGTHRPQPLIAAEHVELAGLQGSGIRADDMALRLKHAGVSSTVMTIDGNLSRAWDAALQAARNGEPVYVLPTYTAMLQLRKILQQRGLVKGFWEE